MLQRLIYTIDQLSKTVGHGFAWCIIILTFGTCYEVLVRYLLNDPTSWAFDMSYLMYGAVFYMAGAYTLSRAGHVRADMFYRKWPDRTQATVELVLYVLFFFPGILALVIAGSGYGFESMRIREVSVNSPAGVPIWPLKMMIPVGAALIALQGFAEVLRCVLCLRDGHWAGRLHDVEELEKQILEQHRARRRRAGGGGSASGARSPAMTDPGIALTMLGILVFTIMIGFPVAFTLMALGVGFGYYAYFEPHQYFFDNRVFYLLTQNTFTVLNNDALVSIPLFLLMGYLVERANILDNLFKSLQVALKGIPGSLAVATLATCALFATATGIVGAVVTLMGMLAFPQMIKAGYDTRLAAGVVCAGGCLGILIPPSIMLIVYGAIASISVVKLYAAAVIPGFVLAGMYIVYVVVLATIKPQLAPPLPKGEGEVSMGELFSMLVKSFFPLALLILSVLGAIMFGLATPTEAAAVGAFGAMVLAASYGSLTWQRLREAVFLTARTSAMVCWLFVGSATFASIFAYLGGNVLIKDFVLGLDLSPITFLLLSQAIIFVLGWPLEWTEIIIIFVPIFLPMLSHFNIDPMIFGILVAINLQTAFLSPPMAMAAYYLKGVSPPSVLLTQIFSGCMPFVYIILVTMSVIYVFPQVALWLPGVLYSR